MAQEERKSVTAATQIAAILVIAEQLTVIAEVQRQIAEAARQQTALLERIATALEGRNA